MKGLMIEYKPVGLQGAPKFCINSNISIFGHYSNFPGLKLNLILEIEKSACRSLTNCTYRTSRTEVFIQSLRLPSIFTWQGSHPVWRWQLNSPVWTEFQTALSKVY